MFQAGGKAHHLPRGYLPSPVNYSDFFQQATGNPPYDYQCRLAEGPCESRLINIPTGLGKTAAVVLVALASALAK